MNYFPYHQVVDDLRDSYSLTVEETKNLEAQIHILMSLGRLSIYDLNNNKLSTSPTQFGIGDKSIQLDADEVNRLFTKQGGNFKWKPRKKRGAPLKPDSIEQYIKSGQFSKGAEAAATIVRNKNPHNVNHDTVSVQMNKNHKWSASCIKRHLRKNMYKKT